MPLAYGRAMLRAVVFAGVLLVVSNRSAAHAQPSTGCVATSVAGGRRIEKTIDVGGRTRRYLLDVPEGVKPGVAVPLLFDFHGFGHSGAAVWKVSKFKEIAARRPFITVYPEGETVRLLGREGAGWEIFASTGNRDLDFVRAMLDTIEADYCIDRRRVFSTGFSNGGFLSHLLACTMADRFSAVAPVGGGMLELPCNGSRPVPILIHHGRQDAVVPVTRAQRLRDHWVQHNGCRADPPGDCAPYRSCRDGADVVYCEDDGGHHWPDAATERIWSFFESHPIPQSP